MWDAFVVQKNDATGFKTWDAFKAAVAASNPGIADLNKIAAGTNLMVPEQMANGSITYHFAGSTSINTNASTGEYHMVVPNTDGNGGQTVHSRVSDGKGGFTVKQVSTDRLSNETFNFSGHQATAQSDVIADALFNNADTNGDGKIDTSTLSLGNVSYDLFDLSQRSNAEYQLRDLYNAGSLSQADWYSFTTGGSSWLLGTGTGLTPGGGGQGLQPPASWLEPIGAFYDSQSSVYDNAASIAGKTTRAMNANGQAMTMAQLQALDANNDGQISTAEASSLRLWADFNENAQLDTNELQGVHAGNNRTLLDAEKPMRRAHAANWPLWQEAA